MKKMRLISIIGMSVIILIIVMNFFLNNGEGGSAKKNTATSATLVWKAPDARTDHSRDLKLRGFVIYYGPERKPYSNKIVLPLDQYQSLCTITSVESKKETLCTHTIQNLKTGTYSFSITAYEVPGQESACSNSVTLKIGR